MQYLKENGVQTMIHYPIPPHRQKCYADSPLIVLPATGLPVTERIHREELSIPCNPALGMDEVTYIIKVMNKFTLRKV